jgi:hypothetical protein
VTQSLLSSAPEHQEAFARLPGLAPLLGGLGYHTSMTMAIDAETNNPVWVHLNPLNNVGFEDVTAPDRMDVPIINDLGMDDTILCDMVRRGPAIMPSDMIHAVLDTPSTYTKNVHIA